mgnify:CR=1 FL=1
MLNQSSNYKTNFPYEIFPIEIQILLEVAEETLNYPIEYLGSSILSACSVAIGNTYHIKLKEGFIAKGNLYIALVGRAGDVKSHPLKFAYEPIEKTELASYNNYQNEMKEYDSLSDEAKRSNPKPIYKKYILKDFTPESLIKLHSNNKRGQAIVSDELFGWIKNFGRYNSSGEQETYLSLWNGHSISVDRKSEEPIRIDNTYVNIIGTMQTKILPELNKENRGSNGFIERLLFAENENPKPVLWSTNEIEKDIVAKYHLLIERLFTLEFNEENQKILEFTVEAKKKLIKWQNKKREDLIDDEIGTSIQAKYEVYAIRFSLIIQLIYWALNGKDKDKIELFAVENSIKLAEYYFDVALKINHKINKTSPLSKLTKLQKELYENLNKLFTTEQARIEAEKLEIPERTLYRILKNTLLFSKEKHGNYKKIQY